MTGATGNIYFGLWEFHDMGFVLHYLRPDELFVDVGANIGSYSILAAGVVGARALSFEPDPDTARHLRRNIEANRLDQRVSIHEIALADSEGELKLSVDRGPMNRVVSEPNRHSQTVPASTLDHQLDGYQPTMLKLDVEGFEQEVILGGHETLSAPTLRVVAVETNTSAVLTRLEGYGFEAVNYDPLSRTISQASSSAHHNHLFVRDPAAVQVRVKQANAVEVFGSLI